MLVPLWLVIVTSERAYRYRGFVYLNRLKLLFACFHSFVDVMSVLGAVFERNSYPIPEISLPVARLIGRPLWLFDRI